MTRISTMNNVPISPEIVAEVKAGVAPILIGALSSTCLFGANTLQTWYYFQHYPGDRCALKTLVAFVWFLATLHTISVYISSDLGIPRKVLAIFVSIMWLTTAEKIMVLLTGIIIFTAHSFFAWRVYILSSRKRGIFTFLVGREHMVLAAQLSQNLFVESAGASNIACDDSEPMISIQVVAGILFSLDSNLFVPRAVRTITIFSFSFNVATDCLLVSSLGYYLQQSRSGMRTRINRFINKIIFWAINIGALTTIVGFVVMVLVLTQEEPNKACGVYQIIGNLYVASMLATLNHRPLTEQHVLDGNGTSLVFATSRAPASQDLEITTTNASVDEEIESEKTGSA
ncbi:hypothetical protein AB1N83_007682 [Pleurotus pulmonarius]